MDQIDQTISGYVKNNEISGGALLVRKAGEVVYQNKWGYADVAAGAPVEYDSIYRMMSMTKPVTAVGILKLMDRGLITLDDPLSKFLPQFKDMEVCADKRYEFKPGTNIITVSPARPMMSNAVSSTVDALTGPRSGFGGVKPPSS